jgi:hypothetical protein
LLRRLDVRRIAPWWRHQSGAVRGVVVAGVLIGALAPGAMVQHGWHLAEQSSGLAGERGVFTTVSCTSDVVPDTGVHSITCSGAFESSSAHLASTQVYPLKALAPGASSAAYISHGRVEIADDHQAAMELAWWTTFALFAAAVEIVGLSSLVALVRGDRRGRGLGLGLKVFLLCVVGVPASILTLLLLFEVYLHSGLLPPQG